MKSKMKGSRKVEKPKEEGPRFVTCPECGEEQSDMGRNVLCDACGEGAMPWYDESGELRE